MSHLPDPVSEDDLQAYVDDQLAVARRIDVEAYLSRHPAEATRVMADLRVRDELRLAMAQAIPIRDTVTTDAARRLERGLSRGRLLSQLRRAATIAFLIGAGWLAHAYSGPLGIRTVVASSLPPAYVSDAIMAHRTTLVRAGMHSQPNVRAYDPAEIRAATAILLPALPADWEVMDAQIFPSAFGPSVEMAIRTESFGTVSLFAVRPGTFDVVPATLLARDGLTAAYWQVGEVAYALVANADARELDKGAIKLAESLY
jgi:anti-sigma factor RsiW